MPHVTDCYLRTNYYYYYIPEITELPFCHSMTLLDNEHPLLCNWNRKEDIRLLTTELAPNSVD
ncbi:unnamed protein product, partial [Schistosoma margrebowiei]|uniref:Uncharacterized protein n=1 Tax=Schistosoma margrebowiei TaxID=48269 RepID=A0AA84ZSQ6_9TREM